MPVPQDLANLLICVAILSKHQPTSHHVPTTTSASSPQPSSLLLTFNPRPQHAQQSSTTMTGSTPPNPTRFHSTASFPAAYFPALAPQGQHDSPNPSSIGSRDIGPDSLRRAIVAGLDKRLGNVEAVVASRLSPQFLDARARKHDAKMEKLVQADKDLQKQVGEGREKHRELEERHGELEVRHRALEGQHKDLGVRLRAEEGRSKSLEAKLRAAEGKLKGVEERVEYLERLGVLLGELSVKQAQGQSQSKAGGTKNQSQSRASGA